MKRGGEKSPLSYLQGSTPLSLISLPILSVSLLHTALTSHPRFLAGKGAERQIEKTQTYTTPAVQPLLGPLIHFLHPGTDMLMYLQMVIITIIAKRLQPGLVHRNIVLGNKNWK